MIQWASIYGKMRLPDDMPEGALALKGGINWKHQHSAMIHCYIKVALLAYANLPGPAENRNKFWEPLSYETWQETLHPKLSALLCRPQAELDAIRMGVWRLKSLEDEIGNA